MALSHQIVCGDRAAARVRPLLWACLLGGLLLGSIRVAPTASGAEGSDGSVVVYAYEDDFTTQRFLDDSHRASRAWVASAAPPNEPTLVPVDFTGDNPMLLFRGQGSAVAELCYHLPVTPDQPLPAVTLTAEILVDVQVLTATDPRQGTMGHLGYRSSADGRNWGPYQALRAGTNDLHLQPLSEHRYVRLLGHQAAIDNLRVRITREAVTWTVPGDVATIQGAVDAAAPGDRILLAAGLYRGPGNTAIDFRGKDLAILGAGRPEDCVIDCENLGRAFALTSGESERAVISNLTVQRGYARQGGGIYLADSSPTIRNCVIRDCVSESDASQEAQGGGIYVRGGAPRLEDCWILANRVRGDGGDSQGGGLYLDATAARIEGCVIGDNAADTGTSRTCGGGGIYIVGAADDTDPTPYLRGNLVVSNSAVGYGAGLFVSARGVAIYNCTIAGNRDAQPGATGLYIRRVVGSAPAVLINSSILWGNEDGQLALETGATASVRFCQVEGGWSGWQNSGEDPLFVDPGRGDYSLRSRRGRWSRAEQAWRRDGVDSPCLDTGDPELDTAAESAPQGDRVNRGAFGGTARAARGAGPVVLHVDGARGNDLNSGQRLTEALATIQGGVDAAQDGDAVLVWPGLYPEDVDLDGKAILVQSAADAATVAAPVAYAFSFFKGEGPDTVLRNFVIRGCPEGGVLCHAARPTLRNLTLVDNAFGVAAFDAGDLVVSDSVLWGNRDGDLRGCRAVYSCVEHREFGQAQGIGNLTRNPRFVDPNSGDYHVQSRFGRYWPAHEVWVVDPYQSPVIDRGDPREFPEVEVPCNGRRVNMGAYGGTAFASRSAPAGDPDLNQDGIVDLLDFALLADHWLEIPK